MESFLSLVPKKELFFVGIELQYRGLGVIQLVADIRNRKVEEISRLKHDLVETTSSLKSSLGAVSAFESRMAKAGTNLELEKK